MDSYTGAGGVRARGRHAHRFGHHHLGRLFVRRHAAARGGGTDQILERHCPKARTQLPRELRGNVDLLVLVIVIGVSDSVSD